MFFGWGVQGSGVQEFESSKVQELKNSEDKRGIIS
jgi:hypothetical protein